jgi:endonuclease/exonuclease/phosphatase family metal-dependent hydrolase
MRERVTALTESLRPPSVAERAAAAAEGGSRGVHDRLMADWPALNEIEFRQSGAAPVRPEQLTITAWNIERCKWVEPSAGIIVGSQADIVLATEIDVGMARSSQRNTAADLAGILGMGYAYGVEFVELGHGDPQETRDCAGQTNDCGLHGNAILSRWTLSGVSLLPLDDGGAWFVSAPKGDGQHRIGGRMAMAANIETRNGPLTLVSAHYESESTPESRAVQTARLLDQIDRHYGNGPCVIGGDLNTAGFLQAGVSPDDMMAFPERFEPSFAHFAKAGFDWRSCNTGQVTTRLYLSSPANPLKTLDWIFVRGLVAKEPFVVPALSEDGYMISDHELIGTTVIP